MLRKQNPNPRFSLPDPLPHIERVNGLKLLGVFVNANFKFDEHVNKLLCLCSQRMYLLKQLKSQGLGIKQLHIVFTALIVSRVLYALPACGGFLSSDLLNRIDSILRKPHKFGYTTEVLKVTDMLQNADKLFSLMFRSGHCLHTLLPDLKMIDIVLRSSGTSFNLPQCNYKLYKRSFVNRCVFAAIAIDVFLLCFALCVSHFQSATIIMSTLIGWRLSVLINDVFMLCHDLVILQNGHAVD